jgi:hypothetical protein
MRIHFRNSVMKSILSKKGIIIAGLLIGGQAQVAFAACTAANPNSAIPEGTPTYDPVAAPSGLQDNGDGTVTHHLTGLMWQQCVHGLSGPGCTTGTAFTSQWKGALKKQSTAEASADYDDWRLPNQRELLSIVEPCGAYPAINQTMFPNLPEATTGLAPGYTFYSSSSAKADGLGTTPWMVSFNDGESTTSIDLISRWVRLVRGGQSPAAFDALDGTGGGTGTGGDGDGDTGSSGGGGGGSFGGLWFIFLALYAAASKPFTRK